MGIKQEINHMIVGMFKKAQAPMFIPSQSYYSGARAIPSKIPRRWKDHALNTAVAAENGWWRFWNNVVPNTPVYLAQLAGAGLGGIKGAFQGHRKGSQLIDDISSNPAHPFHTPARVAKAVNSLNDIIEEGYNGYDAFGTIAKEKWQKPARKWQDILFPYLKKMDTASGKMLRDLEELRKEQARNGNEEALEDFTAAKKLKHLVPLATGAAVLGKVTNGLGTVWNSK